MSEKIALLFPLFLGGGAESVAAWMLATLKERYSVTLFTLSKIDFKQLDRQFGTKLDGTAIEVRTPYQFLIRVRGMQSYSLMTIRQHLLMRAFKKSREDYDLAIAAFNEMDLGRPGVQYVHAPLFGHGNEVARKVLQYPTSPIRTFYQRICEIISGYSDERMKRNFTITNSRWTADLIRNSYAIDAHVLYPPVVLNPPDVPWERREDGFVCSGRISPDKNLETVIEILHQVRQGGHDVHLHILSSSYDPEYRLKILKLRDQHPSWLFIEENLSRPELAQMLAQHRYGIHGRVNETFGISIAEMVIAGCIPFIPAGGGPEEILGKDHNLTFHDTNDAVQKISGVLSDPELSNSLLESLKARILFFSIEKFQTELIDLVASALKQLRTT